MSEVVGLRFRFVRRAILLAVLFVTPLAAEAAENLPSELDPKVLAQSVTIYRDAYGMPHIDGPNDESVLFGYGYAQAEDYMAAKGTALRLTDPEKGRETGMKQFLDEKTYRPGLGEYNRAKQ